MAINTFNFWGAVVEDVLCMLPNAEACNFGGEACVKAHMARNARLVASYLRPDMFEAVTKPRLEIVVENAEEGQTTAKTAFRPIFDNSFHIWRICKDIGYDETHSISYSYYNTTERAGLPPRVGCHELDTSKFTIDYATGDLTFVGGLNEYDQVVVSYDIDVEAGTFVVAGCADLVVYLTAADLSIQYGVDQGSLHDRMGALANRMIQDMKKGDFIPAELNHIKHWKEITRKAQTIRSMPIGRKS